MDCELYCIVFLILWLLYQLFFYKKHRSFYNECFTDTTTSSPATVTVIPVTTVPTPQGPVYVCKDASDYLAGDTYYSCGNPKQTFDPKQMLCVVGKDSYGPLKKPAFISPQSTNATTTLPNAPVNNAKYKCNSQNDALVGKQCYSCSKVSTFNPTTMQCAQIVDAYSPLETYVLANGTATCNDGYIKSANNCVRCKSGDIYNGRACQTMINSAPITVYNATDISATPATTNAHRFNGGHGN